MFIWVWLSKIGYFQNYDEGKHGRFHLRPTTPAWIARLRSFFSVTVAIGFGVLSACKKKQPGDPGAALDSQSGAAAAV